MIWTLIHIIDLLLWIFIAGSVMYVFFFSLVATFHRKNKKGVNPISKMNNFLIIYPAYNEDNVIKTTIENILKQTYSKDYYDVVAVSDHMSDSTNDWLHT